MKMIPRTKNAPVLRTDFSDDAARDALSASMLQRSRAFRVIPVKSGASRTIFRFANMDFREFADSVDPDEVFRGFAR